MTRLCARVACAWLAALACVVARADSLETIRLQYRLAEDVIPILQPLLPADAAITGTGDVLLVRADAATVREIRAALASLDRAPRQLLITVGQSTDGATRDAGVHGTATIGSDDVQVGVNRPPGDTSGARVTVRDQHTRADVQSTSSVRALEGYEAYVDIGESRPFTTTTVGGSPYGPIVNQTTDYRSAQTGFYATPRVVGDHVTLEISPQQQRMASEAQRGTVATQTLTTTVSGRLGEWIALGGVRDDRAGTQRGLITWGTRSELTQYAAWVKVEAVE